MAIRDWQMNVNVSKCELLPIDHNNLNFPYKFGNHKISSNDCSKDLGVLISNDLSFENHILKITRAAHVDDSSIMLLRARTETFMRICFVRTRIIYLLLLTQYT